MTASVVALPNRGTLHELACTGPSGDDCVCVKPVDPHTALIRRTVVGGVDSFLSNLESLLMALEQRDLSRDQVDRLARLLQYGERMAIMRVRPKR